MNTSSAALVIGAGVAGCATAIALHKAGIQATVLERRPDPVDPAGIMLTLATNGIDALRAIDADQRVVELGFATPEIGLRTHTGKRLGANRTGGVLPDGTLSQTLRRADLTAALRTEATSRGIPIVYGARLKQVEEHADGIRAILDDGTTYEGDFLVGADGVHSVVRNQIDARAPKPTYTGLITTGGYATGVHVGTTVGTYEMIFGKRGFCGYAAAPDDTVWWFVNVPHPREPTPGELRSVQTSVWRDRLAALFSDDAGPALDFIAATEDFPAMKSVHTLPHLPRWHTDRMTVLGDAAHAPSPTSGQGASLSIEDAVVLAQCLRAEGTLRAAFTRFEAIRRPRVEKIIKAASRINNAKAPGPIGRGMRDLMLPSILRLTANAASAREVYEHHLVWDGLRS